MFPPRRRSNAFREHRMKRDVNVDRVAMFVLRLAKLDTSTLDLLATRTVSHPRAGLSCSAEV